MSEDSLTPEITLDDLEAMLKRAVFDTVVACPYCEYEPLEADYENCPECNRYNPLKKNGMI